jgi:PAS domain-containing protein
MYDTIDARPHRIKCEIEQLWNRVGVLQEELNRHGDAQNHALAAALEELHIAVVELLTNEEDIRLRQEARLRRERRRHENLFEHTPDAYVVTPPTTVIQEANATACSLQESRPESVGSPAGRYA